MSREIPVGVSPITLGYYRVVIEWKIRVMETTQGVLRSKRRDEVVCLGKLESSIAQRRDVAIVSIVCLRLHLHFNLPN